MAKVSAYPETTATSPDGWLFIAELQPDGSYITKKVSPDNLGAQGPIGLQGLTGPSGAGVAGPAGVPGTNGTNGAPGTNGTNGINGAAGATGATGADGPPGYISGLADTKLGDFDGLAVDYFEQYALGAITTPNAGVGWGGNGRVGNGAIVSRTTRGGLAQKRLELTGTSFIARTLPYLGKWNRLRIGVLARIAGPGVTFNGNWACGVCNGTANTYSDATTNNFLGLAQIDAAASDDWVFNAATQQDVFLSSSIEPVTRIGVTTTGLSGSFTGGRPGFPSTEAALMGFFVDIERALFIGNTAVNYDNYALGANTNAQISYHIHRSEFLRILQSKNSAEVGTVFTQSGAYAIAAGSELTGVFDTVNFYWDSLANPLEIAAFGVRKIF